MVKASRFVLAFVICTIGWSTAHAAPAPKLGMFRTFLEWLERQGIRIENGKAYLKKPIEVEAGPLSYKRDQFELPKLKDVGPGVAAGCGLINQCRDKLPFNSR